MPLKIIALPKVKEQHLTGIFGNFEEVVNARIAELRESKLPSNQQRVKFFQYLLDLVDPTQYAAVQARFLDPDVVDKKSDMLKYLDPIVWFESKLALAVRLGLDKAGPKRILDLGTGPGHFPVVAAYFGHDVTGTDLPNRTTGVVEAGHLYGALCDVFKVSRIAHKITPTDDLKALKGPYDLVTSILTAFNVDAKKRPWTTEAWQDFFGRLRENVLAPNGSLFMSLSDNKLTPAVWARLKRNATWAVDQNKAIYFETLEPQRNPGAKPTTRARSTRRAPGEEQTEPSRAPAESGEQSR